MTEPTHLRLRVLAEERLGWSLQEIERRIGEPSGIEDSSESDSTSSDDVQHTSPTSQASKRSLIVLGKKNLMTSPLRKWVQLLGLLSLSMVRKF